MSDIVYDQPIKDRVAVAFGEKRYKLLTRLVRELNPKSALEIGSGDGIVASRICTNGLRYVGLEPDTFSLSEAQKAFPSIRFIRASSNDDPQKLNLGKFDVVFSTDVIEHVYEPRKFIQFAKAHLNPGGRLILGTPDYGNYLRNLAISLTNRWDKHFTVWWDGGHIKFFSKKTLSAMLSEAGFILERWEHLSRLPFVNSAIFAVARVTPP